MNISRKGTDGIGWIADHKDERVRKFQLKDGKILATWGKQGWGPGEFDWVHGIVVDSKGAVYAADTYGQRLQKFIPAGAARRQPDTGHAYGALSGTIGLTSRRSDPASDT